MRATSTTDVISAVAGLDQALAELGEVLGSALALDPDVVSAHSHDHAQFCFPGRAAALVRAGSRDNVVSVMRIAHEHRVPVVVQGTRTGGVRVGDGDRQTRLRSPRNPQSRQGL
ncbi:FAD-binding oxidoreductase [Rhodococcus opacus]|nr:FAD-binding oxidoreductase [Rhodococcus opacus]